MKLVISAPARADIASIFGYLKRETGERMARAIVADIRERCSGLQRMPERYAHLPGLSHAGYRRRVYRDYLIIYEVRAERVNVIRILHGASDYQKLLGRK